MRLFCFIQFDDNYIIYELLKLQCITRNECIHSHQSKLFIEPFRNVLQLRIDFARRGSHDQATKRILG